MKTRLMILTAAVALGTVTAGLTATATVDGVGGAATGDATFPLSYATINAAMVDVRTLEAAGGTTISVTAQTVDESAGILLDNDFPLTIDGAVAGSVYGGELAHIRITSSGIGIAGAAAAMVINNDTGGGVTLRDLILTPSTGTGGGVSARALQSYNRAAGSTVSHLFERVMFTAIRPTGHPNAGQPVTNPFVHAASADTRVARLAELRAFSGGGGNNAVELRSNAAPSVGALMTYDLNHCYFTHIVLDAAPPLSRGGGLVISRTAEVTVNINEGCVFSYNDGSGVRTVGTLAPATADINVNGTITDPVFFIYNGWQEDITGAARNEGFYADCDVDINYAYAIGNYQDGIDFAGGGNDTISNTYIADNQRDLDTSIGVAPDTTTAANLTMTGTANTTTLANVTIHNNNAPTAGNGRTLRASFGTGTPTITASNLIASGAGDVYELVGTGAAIYNEDDSALVQDGAHTLNSVAIAGSVVQTVTDRVATGGGASDPNFVSTTFAPVFSVPFTAPAGLDDYLRVNPVGAANLAFASAASPARTNPVSAINVTGANPNGAVPVELSVFSAN
ncbi:MAG: hypothetical protein HUU25_06210 [Candidatus Sumerlaeia bacterium]|nr:hypothetical protein [Candidatus Sumerlaeia bacterium]